MPITKACEQQCLDLQARLRLFLQVLEAVAHAHQHLVVHRDIEPSNVFLDDRGKSSCSISASPSCSVIPATRRRPSSAGSRQITPAPNNCVERFRQLPPMFTPSAPFYTSC
jgi:serine/threonine protein kinase